MCDRAGNVWHWKETSIVYQVLSEHDLGKMTKNDHDENIRPVTWMHVGRLRRARFDRICLYLRVAQHDASDEVLAGRPYRYSRRNEASIALIFVAYGHKGAFLRFEVNICLCCGHDD